MMSNLDRPGDRIDRPEFLAVLGLIPPVTVEDVKQAYLDKVMTAHPDRGGSVEQFVRLQKAFEQATEYARFKAGRMQWLSQWVEQYAEQEQIIADVRALGGRVVVEPAHHLAPSVGADFATVLDQLVAIHLSGPRIDDGVLLNLSTGRRAILGLRRLELIDTRVTSVGLRQLHDWARLEHLDLSGTRAGRRAVAALVHELDHLRSIVLRNTGIGWWFRVWLRLSHRGVSVSG
jgi:hypothetical protein